MNCGCAAFRLKRKNTTTSPYKGDVADRYRADFVVDDKIIVELKAVVAMPPHFEAYLLSYLRASKLRLGYLVNFGATKLQMERRVV